MRKLQDNDNVELRRVLEELLAENLDITVREVSRRHSSLKNASAFTRNPARMALVEAAQLRQRDARNIKEGPVARKAASLADTVEARNAEIEQLQAQVRSLIASHAGCIAALWYTGGYGAMERFWKEYKAVGESVRELGAVPTRGEVVPLKPRG